MNEIRPLTNSELSQRYKGVLYVGPRICLDGGSQTEPGRPVSDETDEVRYRRPA